MPNYALFMLSQQLSQLFLQLLDLNVVMVATSNRSPDTLYEGGINRAAFIPFIGTLRERCTVVSLDYRRHKEAEEVVTDGGAGAPVALGKIKVNNAVRSAQNSLEILPKASQNPLKTHLPKKAHPKHIPKSIFCVS